MDLSILNELVRGNSRLILPNVGAFLVKDFEAGFQLQNLTFSTFLRYDDGKLRELLANRLTLTDQQAAERVQAISTYVAQQLSGSESRCEIPGLGYLHRLPDGQVAFAEAGQTAPATPTPVQPVAKTEPAPTQATAAPIPPQPEGMSATIPTPSPASPPARPAKAQQRKQSPRYVQRKPQPVKKTPKQPKAKKSEKESSAVPVLLVLLLLALLYGAADYLYLGILSPKIVENHIPYFKRTQASQQPSLAVVKPEEDMERNLDEGSAAATSEAGEESSPLAEDFSRRANAEMDDTPAVSAYTEPATPAPNSSRAAYTGGAETRYGAPTEDNVYHLVAGSFEIESNAVRFRDKLVGEGFSSHIIAQESGMHAVTVGSFPTLTRAQDAFDSMQGRIPNLWILHY